MGHLAAAIRPGKLRVPARPYVGYGGNVASQNEVRDAVHAHPWGHRPHHLSSRWLPSRYVAEHDPNFVDVRDARVRPAPTAVAGHSVRHEPWGAEPGRHGRESWGGWHRARPRRRRPDTLIVGDPIKACGHRAHKPPIWKTRLGTAARVRHACAYFLRLLFGSGVMAPSSPDESRDQDTEQGFASAPGTAAPDPKRTLAGSAPEPLPPWVAAGQKKKGPLGRSGRPATLVQRTKSEALK
jgi:hypothetical protein